MPKKKKISAKEKQAARKQADELVNIGNGYLESALAARREKNIKSWRTVINTGEKSGQTIFHLHIHFLAGKTMQWPPG